MNATTDTSLPVAAGPHEPSSRSDDTPVEPDAPRLREIKAQLAEDVRPLVDAARPILERARPLADPLLERARPWADPLVDELRPLINDLRPAVQDLRVRGAEVFARATSAATRLVARIDLAAIASLGRGVEARARRLASVRVAPRAAGKAEAVERAVASSRVWSGPRLPSLPIGGALRSMTRRARPGRWAFRTVAVGLIALVLGNTSLRDAMVAEISWSRSVLETVEMPTIEMPAIELPALELPKVELPTIELPVIQIPAFELPSFQLPTAEPAAPKLVPAQFDLPPLGAYRAKFETQASYPTVPANSTVEWVVALRNTGSAGWYRGVAGAQAALALADGTEVAVQTTPYVAPGQVGWFVVRFRAPAAAGAHPVALFPRIDGRGELPDLGIFAVVTVR